MAEKTLTTEQKTQDTDLWIIVIVTFISFGIFMSFKSQLFVLIKNESIPVLLRTLIIAFVQFSVAGLGIVVVCIFRKDNFCSYGLKRKGFLMAIGLSVLCFIPYFAFLLFTKQLRGYSPLSVMITDDVLASGFPVNAIGMLIIAIVWGFFESFNYVVISDKINKRYPTKHKWLNWGAIVCAIVCILMHPFSITVQGIFEMLTMIIIIYGMVMVKDYTGNAWGCVFIFMFFWNAF